MQLAVPVIIQRAEATAKRWQKTVPKITRALRRGENQKSMMLIQDEFEKTANEIPAVQVGAPYVLYKLVKEVRESQRKPRKWKKKWTQRATADKITKRIAKFFS